jgi:hypothetical protein
MLRAKVNALRFVVIDRKTRQPMNVDVARNLTLQQIESMGHDPEMMRQFAHFVRQSYEQNGQEVEVHVFALCSLNGRKPQLVLDPAVDLSREPWTWSHASYLLPLTEPFREEPWPEPVSEWEKYLKRPKAR